MNFRDRIAVFVALAFGAIACADIKTVVGLRKADYAERYRQTYRIEKNLSPDDRAVLEAFLRRLPKDDVLEVGELAAIKNNVADVLIDQTEVPDSTLDLFLWMYADPAQGELWRGYIVQKMAELAQRLKSPESVGRAVAFLWSQVTDLKAPYGAEAGLGLSRLQRARPDLVSADEMARRLAAYVAAKDADPEIKRVLLQVLARYDPVAARMQALSLLAEENSGVMLKASAIASLGLVGQSEDVGRVQGYLQSPDIRLSEAAAGAVRSLRRSR